MPDRRHHRGAHPEDEHLFGPGAWELLRQATSDACWLLSRGYALPSSLKLVGDRYNLAKRQRIAVARCACSEQAATRRGEHQLEPDQIGQQELWIDGYNVLTSIEAALAGAVILGARDGCYRDMASVHGSYRRVAETVPAIALVGKTTEPWALVGCRWFLDRPVSNSGRLKAMLLGVAAEKAWHWHVELANDPDPILSQADSPVASSDSVILDQCQRWINLARRTISQYIPHARIVDLSGDAASREVAGSG